MKRPVLLLAGLMFLLPATNRAEDPAGEAAAVAEAPTTPVVGDTFPEFAGKTYDDKPIALSDYKGKVLLIDFWATWCGPCRREIPNVRAVYDKFHDKGFDVVAISLDHEGTALKDWYEDKETTLPWPSIYDGKGWESSLGQRFGIQSIPAVFLLDREGKVISTEAHGRDLWKEVGALVDPAASIPPDYSQLMKQYASADAATREKLKKDAMEWKDVMASDVGGALYESLSEENPSKEVAQLGWELLKSKVDEGKELMYMDVAALAAYHAGDLPSALDVQNKVIASYLEKIEKKIGEERSRLEQKEGSEEELAGLPKGKGIGLLVEVGLGNMVTRQALYQAKSGNLDAARKTLAELGEYSDPTVSEVKSLLDAGKT